MPFTVIGKKKYRIPTNADRAEDRTANDFSEMLRVQSTRLNSGVLIPPALLAPAGGGIAVYLLSHTKSRREYVW